jgi:Phosphoribosylanthranilate isomerase
MSRIKICGLRQIEDIEAVNRVLPDYIGFIFAPSRRRIDMATAAVLKENLDCKIKSIGVFVNEDISIISEIVQKNIIDLIQLHGDEDDLYIERLKEVCGCPVIKSVGIGNTLPSLPNKADYLLFDTISEQRGGVGKAFDWSILKEYNDIPYFLAGGLSIENVSDAINLLSPFCVDVSSGVETYGMKDIWKIEEFVHLVRRKNNE